MFSRYLKFTLSAFILLTLTTSQFKRPNPFDVEKISSHKEYLELKEKLFGISDAAALFTRLFITRLVANVDRVTTLEYGSLVEVDVLSDTGKPIQGLFKVGVSEAKNFECMGACGPGCPRFGVVEGFTKECLVHDVCVLKFGVKNNAKREMHPECGTLFTKAKNSWLSYGHFFQKVI